MNRVELLEAASMKLAEAVMLLTEAGEKRLAAYAGEIAEIAEILTLPFEKSSHPSSASRTDACNCGAWLRE